MKKYVIHLALLLAMLSLGLGMVHPAFSQSEKLKVLNYTWYIDAIGGFHVVGEVQNVGSSILDPVVIGGTVYTLDGVAQSQSVPCVVYVENMLPQQKAPFLMDFASMDLSWLSQGVDYVEFQAVRENVTDKYQYPDLAIASSSLATDAEGVYWVTGTVQNTGAQTATNVRVIATFLNASNSVVAAGYSELLTPKSLNPSATASFKVGAFDVNKTETTPDRQISSYTLIVQCEGPLLSGTPPTGTSYSSSNSSSTNPSSDSSSDGDSSNPPAVDYVRLATIVAVICVIAAVLLIYRRRKIANVSAEKSMKSQASARRRKQPAKRH